jgi:hypothetical protein
LPTPLTLGGEFRGGIRQWCTSALECRELCLGELAHGRARIGLMVGLQTAFALLVGLLGLAPRALGGLAFAVSSILIARVVWTGLLTVRAAVWSANYPRASIGRYTGRIVIVSSLAVSAAAALAAFTLDRQLMDSRWLFGGGAAAGLLAAWLYRTARVRREFALLAEENAAVGRANPSAWGCCWRSCARIRTSANTCSGWAYTAGQSHAHVAARGDLQ